MSVNWREPLCSRTNPWLLPGWFHPKGRGSVLTYHGDQSRWQRVNEGVMLNAASRGQEFVLDVLADASGWIFKWQQFRHTVNLVKQSMTFGLNFPVDERKVFSTDRRVGGK